MPNSKTVAIDVADEYRAALNVLADHSGFEALSTSGESPSIDRPALVNLAVLGGPDPERRLPHLRKVLPHVPLIVVGDGLGVDEAVRLMRLGAVDVIRLPANAETVAHRCLSFAAETYEVDELSRLVGGSPEIVELKRKIANVAPMNSTVLLSGETGTGKGLVARLIHELSKRAAQPFIHVDCSALSPTVIESELFGHERGAFTGAIARRAGRFELAGSGTVFLDEVGDMDVALQTKLLRVLEDREYERVGGTKTIKMNARVIAATNRDLPEAIRQECFRSDLYFRLNVCRLHLPALRERTEDIPLHIQSLLPRLSADLCVPQWGATQDFIGAMTKLSWYGNVRELINILESAIVQNPGGPLDTSLLREVIAGCGTSPTDRLVPPPCPSGGPTEGRLDRAFDGLEMPQYQSFDRDQVAAVLVATGGNLARAARRLGVPRSTLRYWVRTRKLGDLIPND